MRNYAMSLHAFNFLMKKFFAREGFSGDRFTSKTSTMERRNLFLGLLFSLFFAFTAYAQPNCGGYAPAGDPPLDFVGMEVGSSFVADADCLGTLTKLTVKRAPGGGPIDAELRIYLGTLPGATLIYVQPINLLPATNQITITPPIGQNPPCLQQGAVYTFTVAAVNPGDLVSLMGFAGNPFPGGQAYTDVAGSLPDNDLFFSFDGDEDGEITVLGNGNSITNNDMSPSPVDNTDFGMAPVGGSVINSFTIRNDGSEDLLLTGNPFVTIAGSPSFTISAQPNNGTIPPDGSLTFTVTFTPSGTGVFLALVNILNTDCSEQLFSFQIQGTGFLCVAPDIPTLEASDNNVCPNTTVVLSILSGVLNDALEWRWYDDICGGNLIGTGTSIAVTPATTTTYYVRGEGNCVFPGNCAEITIVVEDEEAPVITCPTGFTLYVDAECQAIMPDLTLLQGTVLTNSKNDFSNSQGQNGWSYGYYPPFDPAGFAGLDPANFSINTWFGVQTGGTPFLDSEGGNPGVDDGVWAVRRWVSNHTGFVTVSGEYWDRDLNCGDGANVRIFLNGAQIFQALSIPGTPSAFSENIFILAGDQIDFAIDPIMDTGCDNTEFSAQITVNSGLQISDNCSISLITIDQSPPPGSPVGPGTLFVQLTATDSGGNSDLCSVTLEIEDNTPPTALCQDATVELNAMGAVTITVAQINNGSSDNCGILSITLDQTSFGCGDIGDNIVTLTVTDLNLNVNTCTATVTVEDNIFPTALCQDLMVMLDDLGVATITPQDVDNGSSDNCSVSLSLDVTSFTCSDVGELTATLSATDPSGNTSTCTAQIPSTTRLCP
jgi:hypothetical protein